MPVKLPGRAAVLVYLCKFPPCLSVLTAGIQEKSSNEMRVPETQEVEEGRAAEGGTAEENGRQTKKRRIMDRDDWVAEQRLANWRGN